MISFEQLNIEKLTDGLVPAIIQDDSTRQVLMLGYMNAAALEKTQKEGRVTFFSRTKQRLWTKGETSSNFLNVVTIDMDCDRDTLLIRVHPQGPACHNGTKTCFNAPDAKTEIEGFLGYLEKVVRQRHADMPEGSYTTKLFNKGVNKIAQKVGEEAVETVIEAVAGNKEAMIYEASDLLYHLIVLLEASGSSIYDLEAELAKRHK